MSICDSGIESNVSGGAVEISVTERHPLVLLSQSLPWKGLYATVLEDLKRSTAKGQWNRGRKLSVRIHLGAYLLQQLSNKTDRAMEASLRDNAGYQLFCGREIVEKWSVPDHTKIAHFRGRLSPETQQKLANLLAVHAVDSGWADASQVDIDSTVQEANITYPTDAKLLRKLGSLAVKARQALHEAGALTKDITVDIKTIAKKAKAYFFRKKSTTSAEKYALLADLLASVATPVRQLVPVCKDVCEAGQHVFRWNIQRAITQLITHGEAYLASVQEFIDTGRAKSGKRLSFHADAVACFSRGKVGKPYEFGRSFQIGRIAGNFAFIAQSNATIMHDKSSLLRVLDTHADVFGKGTLQSLATDKGYYSKDNIEQADKRAIKEIGIQVPRNCTVPGDNLSDARKVQLNHRRAGIEPIIGHLKQQGQMGRSRMKNDRNVEASAYASVLGFNLRQTMNRLCAQAKKTLNTCCPHTEPVVQVN